MEIITEVIIYINNKKGGPKMDSRRTPVVTATHDHDQLFKTTFKFCDSENLE